MSAAREPAFVWPELAEEQLRGAWQQCRRPSWPATFEEAMEDPQLSRLVRLNALHPARPTSRSTWPFMAAPRLRASPAANASTWRPAAAFDIKRAAAGDRDD